MKSPEDFTIAEIREFQRYVNQNSTTMRNWKIAVKELATKHGLSDREAIDLADMKLPAPLATTTGQRQSCVDTIEERTTASPATHGGDN